MSRRSFLWTEIGHLCHIYKTRLVNMLSFALKLPIDHYSSSCQCFGNGFSDRRGATTLVSFYCQSLITFVCILAAGVLFSLADPLFWVRSNSVFFFCMGTRTMWLCSQATVRCLHWVHCLQRERERERRPTPGYQEEKDKKPRLYPTARFMTHDPALCLFVWTLFSCNLLCRGGFSHCGELTASCT